MNNSGTSSRKSVFCLLIFLSTAADFVQGFAPSRQQQVLSLPSQLAGGSSSTPLLPNNHFESSRRSVSFNRHNVALAASPVDLPVVAINTCANIAAAVAGGSLLCFYHLRLYLKEKNGTRTWRSAQADTREQWAKFVRDTEGWLYAIQTLRNAITAQTFLSTTVLTLLTVITGRLWEIIRKMTPATQGRQYLIAQFVLVASSLLASAYHFLQSARLMTHAGFMFPIEPKTTKVDRIMRRSQNSQWLGLRFLYLSAGILSWVVGGSKVFLLSSVLLTSFFRRIDEVPQGIADDHSFEI